MDPEIHKNLPLNTLRAIQMLIAEQLNLDPARLDPAIPLDQLGIDSLVLTELLFKLEDAFSIRLDFESAESRPKTLAEIAELIDGFTPKVHR